MSTLAARLNEAMADAGVDPVELARACGVRPQAVYQWQSGAIKTIKSENLLKAAACLKVRPEWLSSGLGHKKLAAAEVVAMVPAAHARDSDGELGDDYVFIDRFDARLSAGDGNVVWIVREKDPISFRKSWFEKKRLHAESCKALYVRGRSMEPKLEDWDTVLIDTADTEIIDGDIYAVVFRNEFYIKTLERTGHGLRLKSENPDFKSIDVGPEEMGALKIIGRKVWRGG